MLELLDTESEWLHGEENSERESARLVRRESRLAPWKSWWNISCIDCGKTHWDETRTFED